MKTYNDVFVEELVVRKNVGTKSLLRIGIVLVGIALFWIAWYFVGSYVTTDFANIAVSVIFLILCAAIFFTFRYTMLEYEYSFFSGDVDIDSIRGMRRRRRVLSFSCKDVVIMAPYKEKYASEYGGSFTRTIDAATSNRSSNRWFIILKLETEDKMLIILEPSQRLLEAFKQFIRGGKFKED